MTVSLSSKCSRCLAGGKRFLLIATQTLKHTFENIRTRLFKQFQKAGKEL